MQTTTRTTLFAALATITLTTAPAHATPPETRAGHDDVTEFSFEDDLVHGDLVHPGGEILQVRRRRAGASLIRIREHFIDRLLKSSEDL